VSRTLERVGQVGLALLFAGMLAWTWGTWPNAFVDFGRELYVPWRLSEGEVLYRDIAWFNGPLSVYGNALLFQVFGPGLRVLVVANAFEIAVVTIALFALLRRIADHASAFAGAAVFLVLFAFSQFDSIGNDNFVTPYSHEVTQGILLSLLALLVFDRLRAAPLRAAAAAGALLGAVALTKAEPFVAAAGGLACAIVLDAKRRSRAGGASFSREALRSGLVAGAAATLPVALAFAALCLAMPASDALRGTAGAWTALLGSEVGSQYFYRATLGVVDAGGNLSQGLLWGSAWGLAVGLIALVSLRVRPERGEPTAARRVAHAGAALATGLFVLSVGAWQQAVWPEVLRPLPIFVVALAVGSVLVAWQGGDDRSVTRAGLLVFASLLLAKILLRVRLDQYGFALAMPATLAVVAAGVAWLPLWVGHRGGDARLARAAFLGILAAVVISLLPTLAGRIAWRDTPIGSGRDAFRTDAETAAVLQKTLDALAERPAGETLAVLPEGVMLNYLARRVNPTGHVNFMPPELMIFGEDEILAAFRAKPPDWIVLTHKDTREYGVGFFGRGYGRPLYAWVLEHYRPVARFGDVPLAPSSRFGTALLERREEATR
jgi:hypothetical protein